MNNKYEYIGVNLSKAQIKKLYIAHKKKVSVTIRLTKKNLFGDNKLPLTKTQINKIRSSKSGLDLNLSIAQLKHLEKTGGFIPFLALLPALLGGIGAAGAAAGGTAAIVTAVKNAKANNAAQAEVERHNKVLEEQNALALQSSTKSGTGILSNIAGKIPVVGETIKHYLQKLGLGLKECNKIENGECLCIGKGLYLGASGSGLFLGPKSGGGLFLGPSPR